MTHFHHCPHCYEAFACSGRCTIEPDLADCGRDFGSHAVCRKIECLIRAAADRYNERFEARCRESLRRLRSPPPLGGRFWGNLPLPSGTLVADGDLALDGEVVCVWDGQGWQECGNG